MEFNWFTIAWVSLAITGLTIEGIALFNSKRSDTLSEHLWAWLGARTRTWKYGSANSKKTEEVITPVWTLRVARTVFLFAMVWFTLHIVTGGWV